MYVCMCVCVCAFECVCICICVCVCVTTPSYGVPSALSLVLSSECLICTSGPETDTYCA